MHTVNMVEAKTSFAKLVESIETGEEQEIIISLRGRPVAKLTSAGERSAGCRIGIAKGKFEPPDDIDADNEEVARLLMGG